MNGPDGQVTYNITDEFGEPTNTQIDLLTLSGANAETIIEDWALTAGDYDWIRLHSVTDGDLDTYVELDGSEVHELTIPSGDLKLVSGFTVPANGTSDFTVDIDLSKALVSSGSGSGINYKLKPAMRMLDNTETGHIQGTVDGNIYSANSCVNIAVYAMSGTDIAADDISDEEGPELVAWAADVEGSYQFELGFLNAGAYTLHLACDPVDDPEADDALDFISGQTENITVIAEDAVTVDFTT